MGDYKTAIIADPNGKAWEFANNVYENLKKGNKRGISGFMNGYENSLKGKYELVPLELKDFRDGEFKPKISENVRRRNCYFIHDSGKEPSRWFSELNFVNQALRKASANNIVDVLPYLKFSRQDRKDESRVSVNSQVVADTISLYADRMMTLDVHNDSIQGFYSFPVDPLLSFPVVGNYLRENHKDLLENLVIGSPDVGGGKRAEAFANYLNKDMFIGYKTREEEGKVGSLNIMGKVEGKNVLFVDDILDSGGTLEESAKKAKDKGAKKVGAYATHGLFTKGLENLQSLDYILIGNTVPQSQEVIDSEKTEIISFEDLFSKSIDRIEKGESISELFR